MGEVSRRDGIVLGKVEEEEVLVVVVLERKAVLTFFLAIREEHLPTTLSRNE